MNDLWDGRRSYTRVVLRDMEVQASIGLHPWERHPQRPTRLLVNVEMFAHDQPGLIDTPDTIMDYDVVRETVRAWPRRPHTELLETLVDELVAVCFGNPRVEACRVSVVKPDIYNDAACAGVEAYRLRPG